MRRRYLRHCRSTFACSSVRAESAVERKREISRSWRLNDRRRLRKMRETDHGRKCWRLQGTASTSTCSISSARCSHLRRHLLPSNLLPLRRQVCEALRRVRLSCHRLTTLRGRLSLRARRRGRRGRQSHRSLRRHQSSSHRLHHGLRARRTTIRRHRRQSARENATARACARTNRRHRHHHYRLPRRRRPSHRRHRTSLQHSMHGIA